MKKTIIIEFILALFLCVFVTFSVFYFQGYNAANSSLATDPNSEIWKEIASNNLIEAISLLLCAVLDVVVVLLIAIFPLPGIKPLVEKVQAKRDARATLRAEKAEADKRKRIEELQTELDELKKDE